jgi:hypothetical protein
MQSVARRGVEQRAHESRQNADRLDVCRLRDHALFMWVGFDLHKECPNRTNKHQINGYFTWLFVAILPM